MLKIKPGDLVESRYRKIHKKGIILSRYFEEVDWFYVFCNGKKERWHISNIVLV
tara:strand:- start:202 stop:363 length:162 start_codon:yes stop_codon:yes gene_type:complete